MGVDYTTGQVNMNWNNPPNPKESIFASYLLGEPDAVDYLAAIADPDGDVARRVESWKKSQELLKNITKASDEIYKRTKRNPANYVRVSPRVAALLEGTDVECG